MTDIYKQVDYVISPTTPSDPFKFGEKSDNQLEMYMLLLARKRFL